MLISTQNDPYAQRLATYAQKLDGSASKWSTIDSSITSADRYVAGADRNFDQANHPQRQAQWDNERTDSSWHGRDLQRLFRWGDQEVDNAENEVRRGGFGLNDLDREVTQTDRELDQLIAEMRQSNDSRLAVVLQASDEVAKAQGNFNGVGQNFNNFDSSARWIDNAVFRADSPIYAIAGDRPGLNVSHHAYRVGDSLRDIERDLRNMDSALNNADRQGDQGQNQLREAAQKLKQASTTTP